MVIRIENRKRDSKRADAQRPVSKMRLVEPGYFVPLVRKLMEESQSGESSGAFVFTAANPREGVSVVTGAVARELAAVSGERVLLADANAIVNFETAADPEASEPVIHEGNGVFRLRPPVSLNSSSREEKSFLLEQLKDLFTFVLIDCPALSVSTEALELGSRSRGIILVATSGKVRRSRLLSAKGMIEASGVPLVGCALNRRTYPIPNFLYRRL